MTVSSVVGHAPSVTQPLRSNSNGLVRHFELAIQREEAMKAEAHKLIDSARIDSSTDEVLTARAPEVPFDLTILAPESISTIAENGLTVSFSHNDGPTTAIHEPGDGTLRSLVLIENVDAPYEYRFELGLEPGAELIPLEDGGVALRDVKGSLVGSFEPPWATDADGDAVPTTYTVDGLAIVQRIAFTGATSFPVVADPFRIPALFVVARFTPHALSQAAARGVSQQLIQQVVQNGVRSAGNKGTSIFTQGVGANRIRVIVDDLSGNIITVTKG
jgi:hypothetical protein